MPLLKVFFPCVIIPVGIDPAPYGGINLALGLGYPLKNRTCAIICADPEPNPSQRMP